MKVNMKRLFSSLMVLAIAGMLSSVSYAQITSGTLRVKVTKSGGGPVEGAVVSAQSTESIAKRTATTNANGVALLAGLYPSNTWIVSTISSGYNQTVQENVLIRTGETTSLEFVLELSSVTESVTVTAETPIVDVRSAVSGQDITLELTESLPTGRSYQNYLQLVPGVLPDTSGPGSGNPASRSGLNYSDIGGNLGVSADNFYYIEGINVTDGVTGTFGANLNTEVVQEQKVITGGIPAEFAGAPGLISSVVTKTGGNEYSGSLNLFYQNDSLVADSKNEGDTTFSTYDTAFTFGGPIVRDKLWFFASYRKLNVETDVVSEDTNENLRTVDNDADQLYGKVTFQATNNDRLSLTYLGDPTDISGSSDGGRLNTRDFAREQGGDRYIAKYQRLLKSAVLDFSIGKHNGEVSNLSAIDASQNDVIFEGGDPATSLETEQLGGFGQDRIDERDTEFWKASAEWFVNSSWAQHTIKGGIEGEDHINFRNLTRVNDEAFVSINTGMDAYCQSAPMLCPFYNGAVDARFVSDGNLTDRAFDVFNTSDFNGLIVTIDALPPAERAAVYAQLDTNNDNTITPDEAADNMIFDSTAGNPGGQLNYSRDFQVQNGAQETKTEGLSFYLQDTAQMGKWTVNLGLRGETWEHFATTGESIFKFDTEIAPRVSVVFDIKGDGKQKVSAYYGRYYDPIRNNLTNFAGTLTGAILEEQVWVNDQYLTFRTRGGPSVQDAFFSPTTKTPYTDEIEVGYQRDLGQSMSIEASLIHRETNDIIEDYDLGLYADVAGYGGPVNDPNSLYLGLDYFGYAVNPGSNFVIATLAGGKREWDGLELVFRKRYSDHWQMLGSYTYSDTKSNTNSDSNADFQGDVLWLDPRAPGQEGEQPGSIAHLAKVAGSYDWDNGFKVGGAIRYSSGTLASRTERLSGRNLPIRRAATDTFTFAGFAPLSERWLQANSVGSITNPAFTTVDARVQYNRQLGKKIAGEFFIDIFNLFDDQAATRDQDLVAGNGTDDFGDPIEFVSPRRFFIGARVSF